ncbi:MAG TPA: GSCFA domain-containing protein [Ferruginibacter sp.]|nr:GSCFA domain-containing protein [Ferruginibacter sp.]
MDFHLNFDPKPFAVKIEHHQKLLLIGSCFTENIGNKLQQLKFSVQANPNGILFNPVSIATSLLSYIENKQYTENDLFYQNESWNSWQHHSRFSNPDKNECLAVINESQQQAHHFLKIANWVMITLGSGFVYELENNEIVANCHKVPTDKFNKKLLNAIEIKEMLDAALEKLFIFNPNIKIIFTISPVRHLRDGFVENNRSKAALIQAVHQLISEHEKTFYFPAYELVIDDLRDYRFYAEDMVHPNYAATNYVWEKFITTCIDERAQQLMKEINIINAAKSHKPFNPASAQHKKFLQTNLDKVKKIQEEHAYIDLTEEIDFFINKEG